LLKSENSLKTLYTTVLSSGQYDDFSLLLFIQLSSLIIGACMILASVSLGVCGAYKMNRSCMAAVSHREITSFTAEVIWLPDV